MQEILKVAVVLLMAIPFAYMFYDVLRDLVSSLNHLIAKRAKPVLIQVISSLFN